MNVSTMDKVVSSYHYESNFGFMDLAPLKGVGDPQRFMDHTEKYQLTLY